MENFESLIRGKNINFLIGSGASVPMYPTLNLGKNMPSFEEVVSDPKTHPKTKKLMYLYYFSKWIYPMGADRDAFETIYRDEKVWDNYSLFIRNLSAYLQNEGNERPKRINIFTTNYDLLFERVFDEFILKYPLIFFNDGSRGVFRRTVNNSNYFLNVSHSGYNDNYKREVPTINLFKMHGSLSWLVNENKIFVEEDNRLINDVWDVAKLIKSQNGEINKILDQCSETEDCKVIEYLNDCFDQLEVNNKALDDFYQKYQELPIINPDKYKFSKTVSEQHYYQLIRSFSYELEKKQTILIVFGFSFADEHIKSIFERSLLNPELLVIIIAYSQNSKEYFQNMFEGYKNVIIIPDSFSDKTRGDFEFLNSMFGSYNE